MKTFRSEIWRGNPGARTLDGTIRDRAEHIRDLCLVIAEVFAAAPVDPEPVLIITREQPHGKAASAPAPKASQSSPES